MYKQAYVDNINTIAMRVCVWRVCVCVFACSFIVKTGKNSES